MKITVRLEHGLLKHPVEISCDMMDAAPRELLAPDQRELLNAEKGRGNPVAIAEFNQRIQRRSDLISLISMAVARCVVERLEAVPTVKPKDAAA